MALDPAYVTLITKVFDCEFRAKVEKITKQPVVLRMDKYPNVEYSAGFFIVIDLEKAGGFGNKTVGVGYLTPMSGCCGLIISHNSAVSSQWQRKGIGTLINKFRLAVAKELGYSAVICTDTPDKHIANTGLLAKLGWKPLHSFTNRRTMNKVTVSIIEV